MSASSRGGGRILGAFTGGRRWPLLPAKMRLTMEGATATKQLCSRCAAATKRLYSSPATAEATASSSVGDVVKAASTRPEPEPLPYELYAGVVLTRPPILTRELHPFENAFFFYQKRLEERLNSRYIPSVHHKPDTVRLLDWEVKIKERKGVVAKELGMYRGQLATSWNDELRVGDRLSSPEHMTDSLLKDAEVRVSEDAEVLAPEDVVPVPRPMPRRTEADEAGDVTRLDRELDRTLYLVVEGEDGWGFPAGPMVKEENLHKSAQRVLDQAAGVNMNIWLVGRVPIAHLVSPPVLAADGTVQKKTRKTFFLKARIMAGQADLSGNPLGFTQFRWLTREELVETLSAEYFRGVRNMMPDR
ncbi:hypothetical protein L249_2176 [Ophiocordyceps polyrhachis-furcata BCC 54312]|uniref:Large ribosomal subunit protein mL46 n=1 Tax=Ophiocordyceps polyrhachis-furcata BCC 54312 TaxID=1330021 RepID=A0A367LPC0_9HYPO|nr:hypothetical protein L249_2176 [Ophiocordyceps polyrhachis-furcata BCC 54312]